MLALQNSWEDSVDLSGATKLQEVAFRPSHNHIEWVTTALKTITPEHRSLRRISIVIRFLSIPVCGYFNGGTCAQWGDLDRVLVQLWYSHSIRVKFVYFTGRLDVCNMVRKSIRDLLPEITKEGAIRLVNIK